MYPLCSYDQCDSAEDLPGLVSDGKDSSTKKLVQVAVSKKSEGAKKRAGKSKRGQSLPTAKATPDEFKRKGVSSYASQEWGDSSVAGLGTLGAVV